MLENEKFNAAVAADFLEKVSQCLYQEYDAIYDLNLTEDNFDVEKLLFHCFSSSYKISFSYEQLPLLRSLLLLLCSNTNLLMSNGDGDTEGFVDERQLKFDFDNSY
ncbi:hypothetical protein L1D51_20245 [Pseudoalteromonas shioyasakiensis]|uniref:hypothetical protein n=1 Tax=Pseudoalteromonas shioyasakiensis TaxID=1190813 RepID=UPI001EFD9F1C|nr:hypothetical protein [Pseudoalteromonas shioyasakiensis]MCG9736295.1 hypothetical protein [Pseudoalteromonas shioyasakiensis]